MSVTKNLDLDVARVLDELFDEYLGAAKSRERFARRLFKRSIKFFFGFNDPHPTSTAAM